jgi:hypothetical protein
MKMNLLKTAVLGITLGMISLTSCNTDSECDTCPTGQICEDGECIVDPNAVATEKSGKITSDETWTADAIWTLNGRVIVEDGVTLTIEPGTIIKGAEGTGASASALIVARGAKINAIGTAANPIIFTSTLDNIVVGEQSGSNLDEGDAGKWGGVLILGNAKISAKVGDAEAQIEGIPADETYGKYGGSDDSDNSGTLKYVSIRHGGALIGEGNEINGLTLGGVGNGTSISFIEIVSNLDDGIECFGGSVNLESVLSAYQGDDGFDIDQNYSGTFNNSIVVYNNNGDEFLEIDGPENATYSAGMFTISNSTFISKTADGTVDLKSKAQGVITDCKFTGLVDVKVSASYESDCLTSKTDAYDKYVASTPTLEFKNNNAGSAVVEVYTKSEDDSENVCALTAGYQTGAESVYTAASNNGSATGANQSDFDWTWTALNNKF